MGIHPPYSSIRHIPFVSLRFRLAFSFSQLTVNMPVVYQSSTERFKIPEADGSHVFFRDIFGTTAEHSTDRMAGIWFRIEKGPEAGPPRHTYDESGVVWEGTVTLRDETGNIRVLGPGD